MSDCYSNSTMAKSRSEMMRSYYHDTTTNFSMSYSKNYRYCDTTTIRSMNCHCCDTKCYPYCRMLRLHYCG